MPKQRECNLSKKLIIEMINVSIFIFGLTEQQLLSELFFR
jgi:hypothetical protein